ncbi:MAG TPA: helix-turn-helix transcriptional regulator [Nitrososphaerales archaeon]|nr:helix-turn-helix transcriptional regulator [Nitrososphaerales archaeon]
MTTTTEGEVKKKARVERPIGPLAKRLGENLLKLRTKQQLSSVVLARRAGVSGSAIRLIESGRRSPSIEMLERLAGAMGVDPREFLRGRAGGGGG